MFTECPQCKTAFRLTAKVLRQAQGRVRCGGCGSTFNAIDHLSEETPADPLSHTQSARAFDQQSRALLDSLDELAGRENVRIEDTGVEWRVLDVDGASNADDTDDGGELAGGDATGRDDADDHAATGTINWTFEDIDEAEAPLADDAPADIVGDADDTISASLDAEPDTGAEAAADVPVLDSADTGGQTAFDLPEAELRFDDHTPLPDEYYKPSENPDFRASVDDTPPPAAESQDAEAVAPPESAGIAAAPAETEPTDDGDWEDLLAEVDLDDEAEISRDPSAATDDVDSEPAVSADSFELLENDPALDEQIATVAAEDAAAALEHDPAAEDIDAIEAQAEGDSVAAQLAPEESEALTEPADDAETAATFAADEEFEIGSDAESSEPADEDELARSVEMEIDQELMRAAAETGALTLAAAAEEPETESVAAPEETAATPARDDEEEDPALVESIVMEGDTVTDLLLEAEHTTLAGDSVNTADDASDPSIQPARRYSMLAVAAVLVIALAAQLVHANRETLATHPGFAGSLSSLYGLAGNPLTPRWDVGGWQFESTNGSTDAADQRLTIFSRISNRSDDPLPYPLVHLALTDRFEEVVGSRILTPAEYLAGTGNPDIPVAPGAGFTAVIAIDAPSPDATGFKLNVCYRQSPQQLRCAIEDFRD